MLTDEPAVGAIAHFAAWINLFNLLPVWQLDGARGFRALSKLQRAMVVALMVAIGLFLGETFLYILAVLGAIKIFSGRCAWHRRRKSDDSILRTSDCPQDFDGCSRSPAIRGQADLTSVQSRSRKR